MTDKLRVTPAKAEYLTFRESGRNEHLTIHTCHPGLWRLSAKYRNQALITSVKAEEQRTKWNRFYFSVQRLAPGTLWFLLPRIFFLLKTALQSTLVILPFTDILYTWSVNTINGAINILRSAAQSIRLAKKCTQVSRNILQKNLHVGKPKNLTERQRPREESPSVGTGSTHGGLGGGGLLLCSAGVWGAGLPTGSNCGLLGGKEDKGEQR